MLFWGGSSLGGKGRWLLLEMVWWCSVVYYVLSWVCV